MQSGSPMKGTQENSNDQRPQRRYQSCALVSRSGLTGNQRAVRKCSAKRPTSQLSSAPSVLAMLATVNNTQGRYDLVSSRPTSGVSDGTVIIVEDSSVVKNSPA